MNEMTTEATRLRPEWAQLEGERESSGKQPALRAVDCIMFLAGLYLAVSPWVVGFNGMVTLSVNNLVVGAALAMLALSDAGVEPDDPALVRAGNWLLDEQIVDVRGDWAVRRPESTRSCSGRRSRSRPPRCHGCRSRTGWCDRWGR